jgi:hypothetical protein
VYRTKNKGDSTVCVLWQLRTQNLRVAAERAIVLRVKRIFCIPFDTEGKDCARQIGAEVESKMVLMVLGVKVDLSQTDE